MSGHDVDLMIAGRGIREGSLPDVVEVIDYSESDLGHDTLRRLCDLCAATHHPQCRGYMTSCSWTEPGGYWVNAFGQRLRSGAPHSHGDRWVSEPTKECRGCSTVLGASDPDVCERCDLHEAAEVDGG